MTQCYCHLTGGSFPIRLEIFVLPRRIIESEGSQKCLCFSFSAVWECFYFPFILLRTSEEEDIQPMDIEAPLTSPNIAFKPHSFCTKSSFKPLFFFFVQTLFFVRLPWAIDSVMRGRIRNYRYSFVRAL